MTITLIGAGNVGGHLGRALHQAGHRIAQVFSRNPARAAALAQDCGAEAIHRLQSLQPGSELYLLAVRDDAIGEVAAKTAPQLPPEAILAHTSGATPATVLAPHWPNYGVFYPLQSLSEGQPADFAEIPLCIFGVNPDSQQQLHGLAESLSPLVYRVDDEQRARLHLAAVFINNFINAMLQASHELTRGAQLPPQILAPLLWATIDKGTRQEPRSVQTGPAIRGDQQTLQRHLQQLSNHPELSVVYKAVTAYIQTF